jgi:hypothetical protein
VTRRLAGSMDKKRNFLHRLSLILWSSNQLKCVSLPLSILWFRSPPRFILALRVEKKHQRLDIINHVLFLSQENNSSTQQRIRRILGYCILNFYKNMLWWGSVQEIRLCPFSNSVLYRYISSFRRFSSSVCRSVVLKRNSVRWVLVRLYPNSYGLKGIEGVSIPSKVLFVYTGFFLKDQEGVTPTAHFIRKRKVKVRPWSFYNQ